MSCKNYEEWLALDVGGDLSSDKTTQLVAHLAECDDCRRSAEELRGSQAALRAFHRSPIAEDRLAAVRSAVLAELRTGKPAPFWQRPSAVRWLTPRWAWAAAAMALVVATAFWNQDSAKRIEPEPLIAVTPTPPQPTVPDLGEPRPPESVPELRGGNVGARHAVPEGPLEAPPAQEVVRDSPPRHDPVPKRVEYAAASEPEKAEPEITVISPPQTDTNDPERNQDTVLQVASSDPDIKIYWLVGRNGD